MHDKGSRLFTIKEGDGALLTYSLKNNDKTYGIDEIKHPDGNKTRFSNYQSYKSRSDKWCSPTSIKAVDSTNSRVFGEIKVQYQARDHEYQSYVCSNNQQKKVTYKFRVYEGADHFVKIGLNKENYRSHDKFCLVSVTSDMHPLVKYEWEDAGKNLYGWKNER